MSAPISVLCIYRIRPGMEGEFQKILDRHWTVLNEQGLVTGVPARIQCGANKDGRVTFVESFQWKDRASSGRAHENPAILAVWTPMGELAEDMDFLQLD